MDKVAIPDAGIITAPAMLKLLSFLTSALAQPNYAYLSRTIVTVTPTSLPTQHAALIRAKTANKY